MADASLAPASRRVIANGGDEVLISAASLWELTIKCSTGKLRLHGRLRDLVAASGFPVLPIEARHAEHVGTLPGHHRDPFDRMLVA